MTETSRFWNTSGDGDGPAAGYDEAEIAAFWLKLFARGVRTSGIVKGEGNELAVSGSASPLSLNTGAAIVDGLHYENDASLNLTVSTPSSGTTGGRVVLRASWSAQTVRAVIKLNTDGVSTPPALTQTPGTTYEVGLYTFTITTGGVIGSLTRDPALPTGYTKISSQIIPEMLALAGIGALGNPGGSAAAAQLITGSSGALRRSGASLGFGTIVEAMIANGAVGTLALGDDAVDITKLGNRALGMLGRQGGSASLWQTAGATGYTPGAVRMMAGALSASMGSNNYRSFTVALPSGAFSAAPMVLCGVNAGGYIWPFLVRMQADSATQISGYVLEVGATGATPIINWLAIGPG